MNTVSICPRSTLVGTLSASSSSLLILPATEHYPTQVVAGGTNGEVYFMKYDGSTDVVKMPAKSSSPVTALACGNLRGRVRMRPELIAISADGFLQCVHPPYSHASSVYSQIVQSNIAAAYVTDVDGDGQEELVVFMTDRVVRTFRWSFEDCRLHPINKWEVPNQISALAVGETSLRGAEAWLSQMGARFYVCVPFSGHQPTVIYPQNKEVGTDVMLIPFRSHYIYIIGTVISNIVIIGEHLEVLFNGKNGWYSTEKKFSEREIVNNMECQIDKHQHFRHLLLFAFNRANQKERTLANPGWGVAAAAAVRHKNFNCLVTLDITGNVLVYGYNQRSVTKSEITPLLSFKTFSDATYLAVTLCGEVLLIAVKGVVGNVVVYEVPVKSIINELSV